MKFISRAIAVAAVTPLFLLAACSEEAETQGVDNWPPDRITLSVPLSPGGGTDIIARKFATDLAAELDTDVVVENNPGGGTVIGLNELHGADADGSELMIIGTTIASVAHAGQADLTPDDFTILGVINSDPAAIAVRDDSPWPDIESFIADARSAPDTIRVASGNPQGVWDVVAAILANESDLPWRPIPTEGGAAPSVQALLANEVEAAVMSPAEMLEQVRAGNLRILAVGSSERLPFIEDVPTFEEAGLAPAPPGTFRPVVGPPSMDEALIEAIGDAVLQIAESQEFVDWQLDNWLGPMQLGPSEGAAYVNTQAEMYGDFFSSAS